MIIDCIGCLHGAEPKLKGGDLLIITGDLTARHTLQELDSFNDWVRELSYKKKIVIGGNHDTFLEPGVYNPFDVDTHRPDCVLFDPSIDYLFDSGTEFEGLKIWGSPWSHRFTGINSACTAFTYLDETWFFDEMVMKIPEDIDILITHTPAFGILDAIPLEDGSDFHAGSSALLGLLKYVHRPKLHVFSHIHEGYGQIEEFATYDDKMMISVNCSIMNEKYKPVNKPIRIIL